MNLDEMKRIDVKIREEMASCYDDGKMIELLQKRFQIYSETAIYETDDNIQVMLSNMKSQTQTRILVFKLRKDFNEQFAQIISRLDDLEDKINQNV